MQVKMTILCMFLILFLTGCSELIEVVPTEEEVKEEVTKTVTEQAEQLADEAIKVATEEGKKAAEELLAEGQTILDELMGTNSDQPSESLTINGTTEQFPVTLVSIADGDTATFLLNGENIKVRYLLIDTPESNHPKIGKQPFSDEAKQRNKELLESGDITLEFDIGPTHDHFSRFLAYVYVNGVSVQETLVSEGLARVGYVYPPNTRYLDEFEKAQDKAKSAGVGIWSIENYVTDKGFNSN